MTQRLWFAAVTRLRHDRRGAAAITLAVSASALVGFAGIATESGTWYLEKRHGQNVADAAAISGVLTLAASGTSAQAVTAGTAVATINHYVSGNAGGITTSVSVATGTYKAGAFTATSNAPNAVRATITRSPPRMFSALFIATNPSITETAVALLAANSNGVCAQALTNPISLGGSASLSAPNCAIASDNGNATASISCGGSSSITAGLLVSVGGINCAGIKSQFQPPVPDPFLPVQSVTMPPVAASATTCQNFPATVTVANTYESSGKMFCTGKFGGTTFNGDEKLTGNATLNLVPGTYIFYNASFTGTSGTITCTACTPGGQGVTIIMTGSPASTIGKISFGGNVSITLNAPKINGVNAALDGILFYIDKAAGTNSSISFGGGSTPSLTGGIYAPTSAINAAGNAAPGSNGCLELVGATISFSGSSNVAIGGCAADGTAVAHPQAVHLVL